MHSLHHRAVSDALAIQQP